MNKELQELIEWMEGELSVVKSRKEITPLEKGVNNVVANTINRIISKARSLCDLGAGASTGEGAEVVSHSCTSGNSVEQIAEVLYTELKYLYDTKQKGWTNMERGSIAHALDLYKTRHELGSREKMYSEEDMIDWLRVAYDDGLKDGLNGSRDEDEKYLNKIIKSLSR